MIKNNGFMLSYEKPERTEWTASLVKKIITLLKKGYRYKQIEKALNISWLKEALYELRHKPKWRGKIPYIKQIPKNIIQYDDKIGILDIETHGDFYANRGFIISYSIKEHNINKYHTGLVKPKHIKQGIYDKYLCQQLVNDILKFDVIVGYYSGDYKFDLPFIRTRSAKNGIIFPYYDTIKQIDLHYIIKKKFKLTRNTLDNACKLFGIKGKSHIDMEVWYKFVYTGDKKSGEKIMEHNIADTKITDLLYGKINNYDACSLKSI